nr:MAG TPA: hypothetical protein [Caudoviricetes sp.]
MSVFKRWSRTIRIQSSTLLNIPLKLTKKDRINWIRSFFSLLYFLFDFYF